MTRRSEGTEGTGQEGSYPAELLLSKGYEVHGPRASTRTGRAGACSRTTRTWPRALAGRLASTAR